MNENRGFSRYLTCGYMTQGKRNFLRMVSLLIMIILSIVSKIAVCLLLSHRKEYLVIWRLH
jgi:hypothetical protein